MNTLKECKACLVMRPLTDFHKQKNGLHGVTSRCKDCRSEAAKQYYIANKVDIDKKQAVYVEKNKDLILERQKKRYAENIDSEQQRSKKYYYANIVRERLRSSSERTKLLRRMRYAIDPIGSTESSRKYRLQNPERVREKAKEFQLNNLPLFRSYKAKRRAKKINATPAWIDNEKVKAIYSHAQFMTDETGVEHCVDHTVPLNSRKVCGLHWEGNLRVITKADNLSKGNRHWPDMP